VRALSVSGFVLVALVALPARAEDGVPVSAPTKPTSPDAAATKASKVPDPERTRDLRFGHLYASVFGGVWVPSASLVPEGTGLDAPEVGGEVRARLGLGVNGHLVVFAEGGFAHARGGTSCSTCSASSVVAAGGVSAHLTQGFAVDPWISLGAGYRGTVLSVDDVPGAVSDAPVHAIDFARLGLGFDHAPVPWLGFGPFVGVDVGVRLFDGAVYADGVFGVRVTFDPKASGTRLSIDAGR